MRSVCVCDRLGGALAVLQRLQFARLDCVSNTFSQAVMYVFMLWFIYAFHVELFVVEFCFASLIFRWSNLPNFSFLASGFGARLRKAFPTPRCRDKKIETELPTSAPPGL